MQILCVKNKRYLQFYPLWSFGGQLIKENEEKSKLLQTN